eukprot:EC689333.1.p2 GENE.EC689333.1~~EC689333.1.p2  ORF type:complete len:92 (-),score=29.51 EC689333.1:201-476(-)
MSVVHLGDGTNGLLGGGEAHKAEPSREAVSIAHGLVAGDAAKLAELLAHAVIINVLIQVLDVHVHPVVVPLAVLELLLQHLTALRLLLARD